MNLRDYIERMKMWIDKQHFIMRHYKFALGIFLIITVALLGIGIFYPHEEENVHISLDQSNGRDGNQDERGSEKLSKETTHGNRTGKGKNYFKDESDIKNVKDREVKAMFMDDYYMILPVLSEQILGERFLKIFL